MVKAAFARKVSAGNGRFFGSLDLNSFFIFKIDLQEALNQLPLNYRQVAILRGVEELTFREIAVILGINEATARTWFKRAKEKLKKFLQGPEP